MHLASTRVRSLSLPRRWLWWCAALLVLSACSENFGTPPLPAGSRLAVENEGFAGPVLPRAGAFLAGTDAQLWVATDRGLYHARASGGSRRWYPAHFGFVRGDGTAQVAPILDLAVDPTGQIAIHVSGSSVIHNLMATRDGGRTYRQLALPNVITGTVQRVGALPPSSAHPEGAYVAAQGAAIFVRSVLGEEWMESMLPEAPRSIGPVDGNAEGEVILAVETDPGWQVWRSSDGGAVFETTPATPGGVVLDVAITPGGEATYVSSDAVVMGSTSSGPPAGASFVAADLQVDGERVHFLARSELSGGGQPRLHRGALPGGDPEAVEPPEDRVERGLRVTSTSGYVLGPTADLWELRGSDWVRHEFGGGHLSWGAVAADPRRTGSFFLGSVGGRAWRDGAEGSVELGRPNNVSEIRALLADLGSVEGLYAGTFGAQWHESDAAAWQERSEGQFSYLLAEFSSPVTIETLTADPVDPSRLWLGAINGNGPYRSDNGGLLWERVHGGLGQPGSIFGEDGLPAATTVRSFAFDGEKTWMGTFRGGVWRLDPGLVPGSLDDVWVQSNHGLPDLQNAPVDTCCFAPGEIAVDVRDLVLLGEGTLLAATGWGVYRDEGATGHWELSSEGLTNGDVHALGPHPTRGDWVLAAARGNADNGDWIFLSRDAGRTWFPLDGALRGWFAKDVIWSEPSRLEIVVLLDGGGAWRMEISP